MKKTVLFILLTTASLCLASISSATIIDKNYFTRDTESGLDWLDVTKTVGQSFDTVTGSGKSP